MRRPGVRVRWQQCDCTKKRGLERNHQVIKSFIQHRVFISSQHIDSRSHIQPPLGFYSWIHPLQLCQQNCACSSFFPSSLLPPQSDNTLLFISSHPCILLLSFAMTYPLLFFAALSSLCLFICCPQPLVCRIKGLPLDVTTHFTFPQYLI